MSAQAQSADAVVNPRANEEFHFEHKLFSVNGCVFRKAGNGGGVSLYMPLGNVMVAVPVDKLVRTFDIDETSADALLLRRVSAALKYVQEIRPGDSIPSEIIDGRASWMVDPKYLMAAKARLSLQLVAWLKGSHVDSLDMNEFIVLAERPETKNKVQEAFASIAERLGFGSEGRDAVIDLVDRFAAELSYVEALRDQFNMLHQILANLKALAATYRRDRTTVETIARCSTLLAKPIQKIFDRISSLDANVGEIVSTLQRYDSQVDYVRQVRDDMRETYLHWRDIITLWSSVKPIAGPEAERALQETYRFAARNFSAGVAWSGAS